MKQNVDSRGPVRNLRGRTVERAATDIVAGIIALSF